MGHIGLLCEEAIFSNVPPMLARVAFDAVSAVGPQVTRKKATDIERVLVPPGPGPRVLNCGPSLSINTIRGLLQTQITSAS